MDPDSISQLLAVIATNCVAVINVFTPYMQGMVVSMTTIATVMIAFAWIGGLPNALAPMLRYIFLGTFTTWLLGRWDEFVIGMLGSARHAVSLVIPGYAGPMEIYSMGSDIAQRILLSGFSGSWNPLTTIADGMFNAIAALLIIVGFGLVSLVIVLAEVTLMIRGTIAVFVLPFLAAGVTERFGVTAITSVVSGFIKCVGLGILCHVLMSAVTDIVALPGTGTLLTTGDIAQLLGISLLAATFAVGGATITSGLVSGGSAGGGGYTSIQSLTSAVSSATRSASSAARTVDRAASAVRAGGGGSSGGGGTIGRSSGSGSPFGNG